MTVTQDVQSAEAIRRKPLFEQIDFHGLTHPGKVRKENQDHFLVSSLEKRMDVHLTSLPDTAKLYGNAERLAFLAMVADGVGGRREARQRAGWRWRT